VVIFLIHSHPSCDCITALINNSQCFSISTTVIIGFPQLHYKVNEGYGCVNVCAEVVSGQLKPNSSVSFRFTATPDTAVGKFA